MSCRHSSSDARPGLGLPVADAELTAANALAPAWTLTATAPTQVQLPVYYSWQFRTGEGGDFASLARRLTIMRRRGAGPADGRDRPARVSRARRVDPTTTVQVEGALMPLTGSAAAGALVRCRRAALRDGRSRTSSISPASTR